jgi:predicted dehydrogenase
MKTVRAGVVGVGHLGYHHARLYASMQGIELVGVVDVRADRGAEVAGEFGTKYFATPSELLDAGAEAISVAVPTTAHHRVVKDLLERGADVLVEKPIAATLEESRDLVATAARTKRLLQVGHIERFNGAVRALANSNCVRRPLFIECHRLSPFSGRGDDVSVVLDLMIHDLDVILALVKSPIASVDAVGVPIFSKEEDIANVRLRFESGCVANVTASRISIDRVRKIRVFSDEAYVSTDYSEQQILVYRKKPGELPAGTSPMEWITIEALEVPREEPLRAELSAFIDCVRTRQRPLVSGEDGLRALELAFDILTKCRSRVP